MTLRATATASITMGLVNIPVKVYVSASSNEVGFNMISPAGNRVKQTLIDAISGDTVKREDCKKGYEYKKGEFVVFSKDEIDTLDSGDTSKTMNLTEFVDEKEVSFLRTEKTYYLGPDKGGDRAYNLIARTLLKMGKAALAQWTTRGKERLVAINPVTAPNGRLGLVLRELFYEEELRDPSEVFPTNAETSDVEEELAAKLVETMASSAFHPEKYTDSYATRLRNAVDAKVSGQAFTVAPSPVPASAMDLFAALKASLDSKK